MPISSKSKKVGYALKITRKEEWERLGLGESEKAVKSLWEI